MTDTKDRRYIRSIQALITACIPTPPHIVNNTSYKLAKSIYHSYLVIYANKQLAHKLSKQTVLNMCRKTVIKQVDKTETDDYKDRTIF